VPPPTEGWQNRKISGAWLVSLVYVLVKKLGSPKS
jgi:hypothetical protein